MHNCARKGAVILSSEHIISLIADNKSMSSPAIILTNQITATTVASQRERTITLPRPFHPELRQTLINYFSSGKNRTDIDRLDQMLISRDYEFPTIKHPVTVLDDFAIHSPRYFEALINRKRKLLRINKRYLGGILRIADINKEDIFPTSSQQVLTEKPKHTSLVTGTFITLNHLILSIVAVQSPALNLSFISKIAITLFATSPGLYLMIEPVQNLIDNLIDLVFPKREKRKLARKQYLTALVDETLDYDKSIALLAKDDEIRHDFIRFKLSPYLDESLAINALYLSILKLIAAHPEYAKSITFENPDNNKPDTHRWIEAFKEEKQELESKLQQLNELSKIKSADTDLSKHIVAKYLRSILSFEPISSKIRIKIERLDPNIDLDDFSGSVTIAEQYDLEGSLSLAENIRTSQRTDQRTAE